MTRFEKWKMKRWPILLLIAFMIPFVYADFYSFEDRYKPDELDFVFLIPHTNVTDAVGLELNKSCLRILGGRMAGDRCSGSPGFAESWICEHDGDCLNDLVCIDGLQVCGTGKPQAPEALENIPLKCLPQKSMLWFLFFGIPFVFLALAFTFRTSVFGIAGSILLMIASVQFSQCVFIGAYVVTMISVLMLVWFAVFFRIDKGKIK